MNTKYFLLAATLVSLSATATVLVWPLSTPLPNPLAEKILQAQNQPDQLALNLDSYFTQKFTTHDLPDISFGQLAWPPNILGEQDEPKTYTTQKEKYTIAILGDSMVETLGLDLTELNQTLKQTFPETKFNLLNFGAGSIDLDTGYKHLTDEYTYEGNKFSPVMSQQIDVFVLESFAYNHWKNTQSDLDRQWLTIAKIIDTVKGISPGTKIVLAATIAPHCADYTEGSANIPEPERFYRCETVKAYLQNIVNFATSQNFPLANVFEASLGSDGDGDPKYINQGDHIHPSDEGRVLFAKTLTETLIPILTEEE